METESKPALTGRQEALADYAERLSANTIKNMNDLSKGPNVQSMVRYEDPNGLSINRKKYPFESNPALMTEEHLVENSKKHGRNKHIKNEANIASLNEELLSREEMKLQKKLYRQQRKLNKMQMRNDYQQRIDAMKMEQATVASNKNDHKFNLKEKRHLLSSFTQKHENVDDATQTPTGRFANVQQEEESIARAKSRLDKYSEYLTHELQNQNAFDKETDKDRSIKVIR